MKAAFLMGLDPRIVAQMKLLPGEEPELHRVIIYINPKGEYDLEFHQLINDKEKESGRLQPQHGQEVDSKDLGHILV